MLSRVPFPKAYLESQGGDIRALVVDLKGHEYKSRGEILPALHPGVTQRWLGALVPVWGGIKLG